MAKWSLYAFSLFFYAYWDYRFVPLLVGSTLVNFAFGTALSRGFPAGRRRKALLIFGIAANLSLLGFFKYTNFLVENVNDATGLSVGFVSVVLPLGISFFTFQQIAFLVDAYRGQAREYNLLDYGIFVSFFPQLIAGPIVHHREMMPQFEKSGAQGPRIDNLAKGTFIFAIGFWKKVVVADTVAAWVDQGFASAPSLNFLEAWVAALSYTFQIYFDFSGYADMAIGAALMFNIALPINFYSPYKAASIRDFWRRWHISLSTFLRDYLYIPLGGNAGGPPRVWLNLLATFLLGGLWHGAGWTFIVWGGLHGAGMIVHRIWERWALPLPHAIAWALTFLFVVVTWVFFRADSIGDAMEILRAMAGLKGVVLPPQLEPILPWLAGDGIGFEVYWFTQIDWDSAKYAFVMLPALLLLSISARNSIQLAESFKFRLRDGLILATGLSMAFALVHREAEFIYYQF
ncbi:MAG: MBOAT family protein [Alphaproteobacteria bacterium]|nr:MBOAT family protein [Alphaproteobacteria bacterium]